MNCYLTFAVANIVLFFIMLSLSNEFMEKSPSEKNLKLLIILIISQLIIK